MHAVHAAIHAARPTEMLMIGSEGCAEGAACISGRGLDPDALERTIAQNLAVGDAIECDATGETEIFQCRRSSLNCA